MDEKCTNTSSPPSRPMKPKPLVALNHLTVPTKRSSDIFFLLQKFLARPVACMCPAVVRAKFIMDGEECQGKMHYRCVRKILPGSPARQTARGWCDTCR